MKRNNFKVDVNDKRVNNSVLSETISILEWCSDSLKKDSNSFDWCDEMIRKQWKKVICEYSDLVNSGEVTGNNISTKVSHHIISLLTILESWYYYDESEIKELLADTMKIFEVLDVLDLREVELTVPYTNHKYTITNEKLITIK